MEEQIVSKMVEKGNIFYIIQIKDTNLAKRISREELIKKNRELVEQYEKNHSNPFLKKKRKIPDFANKNTNEDISSEETQRIHRNSKIKKEKKLSHKPNRKIESIQKNIIEQNKMKSYSMSNIKERIIPKNNNYRKFKEDIIPYEREGVLLTDKPLKILNVGYKNRTDKTLYCLVEWEQQQNINILESIVECDKIKKQYPLLLLEFYESKLIFLDGD